MKAIKTIGRLTVGCALACCLTSHSIAQSQPRLQIANSSPSSVLVNWTNQVGTSYHVWFTTNLARPFSVLEDAFSADPLVTVFAATTETPIGFFRIQAPTNATTPDVNILSPTDSQVVSGEISVRMGAQLGAQIQGVNLYLDDALVGYLNSGGMNFTLDTTHFANGPHAVYVGAVDTADNETLSSAITLDFENSVRWLDACSLFNYSVPIDVTADLFPADWLVTVTDTNGTIVRTMTGTTPDGNIQTSWDGTDDLGRMLPVENLYQITVDATESGSSSTLLSSASLVSTLNATSISSTINAHGVPEYVVQKPVANPMSAYLEMLEIYRQLTPQEKAIYPLVRPVRPDKPGTPIKMSARDLFLATHQSSLTTLDATGGTITPAASNSTGSGSTKTLAWWENPWSSGKIVMARVPIPGTLGTTVANNCNSIATLIGAAEDVVGHSRSVFNGYVRLVSAASDVVSMTNDLADSGVTAFYFYGHGTANGNALGTQSAGVSARNLSLMFGNYYIPTVSSGPAAGKSVLVTHKGFNLVFLDGCNTALGDLPEAFGMPKAVSGAMIDDAHLHKRAFLGWTGPVTFQIDSSHIDWSLQFWTAWLDEGNADVTVAQAIQVAYQHDPSVLNNVPIRMYGNGSLKWSD